MRRMEEKRVSRPQAWRCPKAGVAVTVVSGESSWAAQRGLGAGRLPAWASGDSRRSPRLCGYQGNWAAPARAGRRSTSNFCRLTWRLKEWPSLSFQSQRPRSLLQEDSNIQACLPLKFTPEEYEKQDMQLVAALSVTLALFAVELAGFFSGVSMFNSTQSLISIGAHCSASVALSFFIFERWECTTYWYIFVFCSAIPAVTEIALFISVFGLKKKPF
ncbi:transmembrane protein 107 isoform X2 [Sagmatias obliquidens]|uniref:transmembrane protein 107 isoform X2 n=1 Tax=Sagmatias obliquidens TaxID=3371155 RepID=UPI000F443039|nr:transmembrane protein 107 isoform X2 [Lagenorhynchus obliquidens]